jgi:cytochrome c
MINGKSPEGTGKHGPEGPLVIHRFYRVLSTQESSMKTITSLVLTSALAVALIGMNVAHAEVDVKQAEGLMKANKCSSCHHPTKTKSGPSLKKIADDFRGKADAEDLIIKQITTGPEVEIDGEKEEHKIIKMKDPVQLKNLAQWILSH